MNESHRPRVRIHAPRELNFLEKILYAIVGAVVLVTAFFFLTVAIIAGAFLALAIIARWWWISRKLRRAARDETLEGQYTVVERSSGNGPDSRD
ncbi:MAG: hypothetical protein HY526_09685 [Betaproteobacteria bacterium]|nr:hypothetical protein [Betaproteobacteria bacterium]